MLESLGEPRVLGSAHTSSLARRAPCQLGGRGGGRTVAGAWALVSHPPTLLSVSRSRSDGQDLPISLLSGAAGAEYDSQRELNVKESL